MDAYFGGQEILETLSQASVSSRGSRGSRASRSTTGKDKNHHLLGGGGIGGGSVPSSGIGAAIAAHQHNVASGQGASGVSSAVSLGGHSYASGRSSNNPVEDAYEDAYRRLGQRLSLRAHGDDQSSVSSATTPMQDRGRCKVRLGHQRSCFIVYRKHRAPGGVTDRSTKVAKIRYSDHGDHHHHHNHHQQQRSSNGSQRLLKTITTQAKLNFEKWKLLEKQHRKKKHHPASNSMVSPQRHAFSKMDIQGREGRGAGRETRRGDASAEDGTMNTENINNDYTSTSTTSTASALSASMNSSVASDSVGVASTDNVGLSPSIYSSHYNSATSSIKSKPKGLLSAVLEASSHSTVDNESHRSISTKSTKQHSVLSLSTKGSTVKSANKRHASDKKQSNKVLDNKQPKQKSPTKSESNGSARNDSSSVKSNGCRCLTQPSTPVANDGLDNIEGNLIVHENDILSIPANKVHTTASSSDSKPKTSLLSTSLDKSKTCGFQIHSLLGQGTFAQVFECAELQTGKHVALKIVKNKPAYTKQAAIEIDVFQALVKSSNNSKSANINSIQSKKLSEPSTISLKSTSSASESEDSNYMVKLISYFMYRSHLCLVFELLGLNLYEVLKRRQFRGLPLVTVQTLIRQALEGIKELAHKTIVHCDLKPENILLDREQEITNCTDDSKNSATVHYGSENGGNDIEGEKDKSILNAFPLSPKIKLIDFGSACFEGYSAHTYIQSRFYRSPEVLIGLPYDSAIDMWSLGCVAAELYLGLPILPGVHEHDQCGRICEMIAELPEWMLEQGSKSHKYFCKDLPSSDDDEGNGGYNNRSINKLASSWRIKTQQEYIQSLSQSEIRKKGGLAKLEKQPANRYFKRKKLSDIIFLHGQNTSATNEEKELLELFVHFLYGLLDPDPWKRWTAHQAVQHPFITGSSPKRRKSAECNVDENQANREFDIHWVPPWDPGICRRKLLNVQKIREKQQAQRRSSGAGTSNAALPSRLQEATSPDKRSAVRSRTNQQHLVVATESPSVSGMSCGTGSPPPQLTSLDKLSSRQQQQQHLLQGQHQRNLNALAMRATSMPKQQLPLAQSAQGIAAIEAPYRNEQTNTAALGVGIGVPPPPNQLMFTGPQSFNGPQSLSNVGIDKIRSQGDDDFGYALQRPGVVPGTGNEANLSNSVNKFNDQTHIHNHQQQSSGLQQQYPTASTDFHTSSGSLVDRSTSRHMAPPMTQGTSTTQIGSVPSSTYGATLNPPLALGEVHSSSSYSNTLPGSFDLTTAGVTSNPYLQQHQQQLLQHLQQPQQHSQFATHADHMQDLLSPADYNQSMGYTANVASLQEQHQQQIAALQQLQQQQLAILQRQQQMALHQHQHQQLQAQQQNSSYLSPYGTTGGGYYYVSSADGTPMLMTTGVGTVDQAGTSAGGMPYIVPQSQHHTLPLQQQHSQHTMQNQSTRNTSFDDDSMSHASSVRHQHPG